MGGTNTGENWYIQKEKYIKHEMQLIATSHKESEQSNGVRDEKWSRNAQVRSANVSTRGCTHRCAHTWAGSYTKQRETLPSSGFSQSLNQSHAERLTAQRAYNSIIFNQ